ncbi:DUF5925 domain-containing protein [Pseudonocardia sp. GCM10023141]|uniref:DUF5925 domain-containing protein n=1 Tax=Pseudonocardia sp. GCM10023141 TaxID=3252653 RepID=UPI0036087F6D
MTPPFKELSRSMLFGGNAPIEGLLNAIAMEPFLTGEQPFAHSVDLSEVGPDAALSPPGCLPCFTHDSGGLRSHVATGPGWTLVAMRRRAGSASLRVCATTDERARDVLELASRTAQRGTPPRESQVPIDFWHTEDCRPSGVRVPRHIDVPPWSTIRRNYTASAGVELERLMALRPDDITGRLLLLHGPAGTGKTTAIRALAHAWRDWCRIECILDPEALFTQPAYLTSVALGEGGPGDDRTWRLLVLEDCDELVRAEAKHDSGQALSRLLNLTDGLLGQGLDVLVCLTTNEDVARLHPAVVRPGRCLAEIECGPLTPLAAAAWLGVDPDTADIAPEGVTLAELYRQRAGRVTSAPSRSAGSPG